MSYTAPSENPGPGGPIEVVLVLEGGRVGAELGAMALLELGSALAAVTSREIEGGSRRDPGSREDPGDPPPPARSAAGRDNAPPPSRAARRHPPRHAGLSGGSRVRAAGWVPRWIDDLVPVNGSGHPTTVIASVPFPSLAAARAAVRRCALTRMALLPMTDVAGAPADVAEAVGRDRASTCAVQVLAPGRRGTSRLALERVGAALWDAGVGRNVAADPPWLEAVVASHPARLPSARQAPPHTRGEDYHHDDHADDAFTPAVYLHPEGLLCEVAAWGLDARGALRAVEAPNAMPPEQAILAVNVARVAPGSTVMDPCVGGGAVLLAALHLGASLAVGADVEPAALDAAEDALRRAARRDAMASRAVLLRASLLDPPWRRRSGSDRGGYEPSRRWVDAIVTDLPYGVRSGVVGVGDGPDDAVSPAGMLVALLRLADEVLRRPEAPEDEGGRVAVWLQHWDGDGGMRPDDVRSLAKTHGFETERVAAESRKTGVQRALYVMTRTEEPSKGDRALTTSPPDVRGETGRLVGFGEEEDSGTGVPDVHVCGECEAFGAFEDMEARRALVMHARLRRNESYGRVAGDGGQDVWRAAWVGDVLGLSRHLEPGGGSVAEAVEPAGACNTPLLAAAGFGRTGVTAALLDAGAAVDGISRGVPAGGATPLLRAAEFGHVDTVRLLLERGANPAAVRPAESGSGTSLHAAAERGHEAVVGVLISAMTSSREECGGHGKGVLGEVLWARDANGRTALEAAARWGHAGVIRALLRAHATAAASPTAPDLFTKQKGREGVIGRGRERHPSGSHAVSAEQATRLMILAVRWGHLDALVAVVECAGHGVGPGLGPEVFSEARRWSRGKIMDVLEEWKRGGEEQGKTTGGGRDPRDGQMKGQAQAATPSFGAISSAPSTDQEAPSIPGARLVYWDPTSGAAVLYARHFWDPLQGAAALRAEVDGHYLPRDDPLVTPADRRGERRAVPRDQAYFAACYCAAHGSQISRESCQRRDGNVGNNSGDDTRRHGVISDEDDGAEHTFWWASYRYNPDHTQQPTPSAPPGIIQRISAKIAAVSGQVCNHAVVNRYRDGEDSIGAHSDKALDLEDGSYVVSVSFGAARVMTFEPKTAAPGTGTDGKSVGVENVKGARRDLVAALRADPVWREIEATKAAARPGSEAKAAAVARERERGEFLRATVPAVAAAAAAAKEARESWRRARVAARWELTLESGSALFFNMAFNRDWTHAIHAFGQAHGDDKGDEARDEEEGDDGDNEETKTGDTQKKMTRIEGTERIDGASRTERGSHIGERIGVTLRRSNTVFDPVRQANAEGKSRGWRKGIWRGLCEMRDAIEAEAAWRKG